MVIGSTAPWTDHEKNVCSFVRAAISSLVMEPGAVVMPIGHLAAGSATWRRPVSSDGARGTVTRPPLQHIRAAASDGVPGDARSDAPAAHRPHIVNDQQHAERQEADQEHLAQELEREDRGADPCERD